MWVPPLFRPAMGVLSCHLALMPRQKALLGCASLPSWRLVHLRMSRGCTRTAKFCSMICVQQGFCGPFAKLLAARVHPPNSKCTRTAKISRASSRQLGFYVIRTKSWRFVHKRNHPKARRNAPRASGCCDSPRFGRPDLSVPRVLSNLASFTTPYLNYLTTKILILLQYETEYG